MSKKFNVNDIVQERKNELDSSPLFQVPSPPPPMQREPRRTIVLGKGQDDMRRTQIGSPLPSGQKEQNLKKSKITKSKVHGNDGNLEVFKEKPEKYSTLLNVDLIKKIKLFAAEGDLKSYEVLERALTEFFEKHK